MKMMSKRIIAFALTVCMLFSVLPPVVLAAGEGTENQTGEKVVYDFALENSGLTTSAGGSFAKAELSTTVIFSRVAELYNAGTLNWKFVDNNIESFAGEGLKVDQISDFGGNGNVWTGLRTGVRITAGSTKTYPAGHWTALELRVDKAGKYDLTLNHFRRANGAAVGEVYLLQGSYADDAAIEAAMNQSGALKNINFTNNSTIEAAVTPLGQMELVAGVYTFVVKSVQHRKGAVEAYTYINNLEMQWKGELNAPQVNKVTYDFSRVNTNEKANATFEDYFFDNRKLPDAKIDAAYQSGTLNWRIAANSTSLITNPEYSSVDSYLCFNKNWTGLRPAVQAKLAAGGTKYLTDYWFAFNLASPGAGTYDAVLNYQTRDDSNKNVKIYLIKGALTDVAQIQSALTEEALVNSGFNSRVDSASVENTTRVFANGSASLGELTLEDSEYTLVVHPTGTEGTYFFMDSVELTEKTVSEETTAPTTVPEETTVPKETTNPEETTSPVQLPVMGHSFEIGGVAELVNGNGTALAGTNMLDAANQNALTDWYDNGVISWKYQMDNLAKFKTESNTVSNTYYFGGNSTYKYGGLRLGVKVVENGASAAYPAGYWTAFTIKAPSAGNFHINLQYQTRNDGTPRGEIYILPGTNYADVAAVEAAMDTNSLRAVVNFRSDSSDFSEEQTQDLGIMAMEAGEYTLVFRAKAGTNSGAYMHLNELAFTATQEPEFKPELPEIKEPKPEGYTFEIGTSSLIKDDTSSMADGALTSSAIKTALEKFYEENNVSWKYSMDNIGTFSRAVNQFNFGGDRNKWRGLRLGMKQTNADDVAIYPAGYWTAFTVKSPGKGNYQINLDYQTLNNGALAGEVYILPGTNYANVAEIEAAMTADNLRQIVDFSSKVATFADPASADLGIMELEEGEYTFVFKAIRTKKTSAYMYLNGLNFTKTDKAACKPEQLEVAPPAALKNEGYTFELGTSSLTNVVDGSMIDGSLTAYEYRTKLLQYYEEGYISWKYALDNISKTNNDDTNIRPSNTYYFGGESNPWSGLRLGMIHQIVSDSAKIYPAGYWTAFTIKSPGTGKYQVSLDYQTRADGTPEGMIYILKGTYTDIAAVEAAMKDENLRQIVDFTSNTNTFTDPVSADLGIMDFEDGEYTIVFKANRVSKKYAYMYLNGLTFTETNKNVYRPELPALQEPKVPQNEGYSFQLGASSLSNIVGGSLDGDTLTSYEVKTALKNYYNEGKLSWKYALDNVGSFAKKDEVTKKDIITVTNQFTFGTGGSSWSGLRFGMKNRIVEDAADIYPAGYWGAITVKAPGAGKYQISLSYQTRNDGTPESEIYILPGANYANVAEIEAAMTAENLRQVVNFASTSSNFADPVSADLGIMELTEGEYTIVFKAARVRKTTAYMYVNDIVFTATDKAAYKPTLPARQEPVEARPEGYNFKLGSSSLSNVVGGSMMDGALTAYENSTKLLQYYEDGYISWKYAADNIDSFADEDKNIFANNTFYFGGESNPWTGLRLGVLLRDKSGETEVKSYPHGYWTAFTMKSPGTGNYKMSVGYQTRKDSACIGDVFVIKGTFTDHAALEAAMTVENLRQVVDFTSNVMEFSAEQTADLGVMALEEGEYTVVFRARAGSAAGAYMHISGLSFERTNGQVYTPEIPAEKLPKKLVPQNYSFQIGTSALTDIYGKYMAGTQLTDPENLQALEKYYIDGYISWKYQMDNLEKFKTETNKVNSTYYIGGNSSYSYDGLRLGVLVREGEERSYPAGYWTAFTMKSPGTGNYKMSVGYQTRKDGSSAGEVYIIKGVFTDAAALEAAMNAHSLRAVVDFSSGSTDFSAKQTQDLGIMAMEAGEYTLVFRAKTGSAAGAYMHVNGLTFAATDAPAYTPELPEGSLPVELVPQGYTFAIGTSPLTNTYGATMAGTLLTNPENLKALEKYYADGYISWKYLMDNLDNYKTQTNKVNSTFYIGGNNSYKYTGLRLGVLVIDGETRSYPAGHWTAFTMKSPGIGKYKIELGYQTRNDSTSAGEVYIIKGNITDKAALEAAMTADNLRQVVDFTGDKEFSDVQKIDLGIMEFAAGEYTLVFRAKAGSQAGAYMHIDGLNFTATNEAAYKPELPAGSITGEAKPIGYSFKLGASNLTNIYDASMAGSLLINKENLQALEKYYADGFISWKYAADNFASFQNANNKVSSSCHIGDGVKYKWNGLRLGLMVRENEQNSYPYGYWTAFTIKSPGKGMGYLTLDYQTRADGTQEAEIYIIKGALTDPAQIEAQLVESNKLNYVDMKGASFTVMKDKSKYLGAVNFEEGEYTLVFRAAMDSGNKAAYMFIDELHIKDTAPPAPTEFVFDFDLNNQEEGIYKGKALLKDKISDIQARYEKGKLNWMYYGKDVGLSDDGHRFNWRDGLGIYTMEGNWMAFKIKSPGPGVYTFILNHAISGNGALGAIYVLPANTPVSQIPTAMDHSNRVGKVEFYNDTGTTPVVGGATSTVGAFELGSADEYVIVFEAYDNTPYKNNFAYMWLTQLILKKGDYTTQTVVGQRKIKPIVVDEGPCRTMEPTIYLTTGEVNGQDYLFMPTEGKKMYVFNLEDMVKVREVTIPFNTCRGIGTDKDGMIWLVGDTSLVHRYDPYTNTGMTTYNYKLSGGIDNSTTAFDMEFDDQGNVYFGTFSMGYVVKYDPQADKFSKVGGDINPDAGYSCGIEVKDGFLYAAVSGDRNSDGVKIAEVVKIDLATNKIVSRVDIKKQFGDKEVMVRGAGICGNTLFMGGASMEGFVALDINTMELKDYGMTKQISYAPTEEIDGKCYMVVSGYGVYQYDSATDTLTKIPGMDTATIGFRAQKHSSITLSNNPLFPGTSYITNTGTGLKVYNMETKQVFTPHLYDEKKDGSGQIIRTIVRGEEGDENIYVGGFNTINCAQINTITGERTIFEATSAQTDVMLWHEGALYVGNYNAGNVVRINFEDPEKNVILLTMKSLYKQARVHALAAGDDYLFAGSIPDAFLYGGCLAIINLKTQERIVEENLIPGQCITSLAYNDGIVFGGTSTAGGTGAQGSATGTESAVIFAYDVEKKEKVAELDLRKIFPGLPSQLQHIDGLIEDPDIENNGKFWGMISETLFTFTFDKETNTFKVKEELSFGYDKVITNRSTDDCNFAFDGNGYLYVAFGEQGGMRKVNMANPKDNERINMETPKTFALGPDGNLYYSCANAVLKMFPLNVTEADWVIAEAVDKLILDIGEKITLDSEKKVTAARAAYDALDLKHKSLVQFLEILEIAETDLLECKIDAIGEVTLDKRAEIEAILAAYNALTAIQQKYVKNYALLNEADLALQGLINAQVAAEMQKIIDAMKDAASITLDDYDYVMGIKAQYDALKFLQRQLVDATKLEAALAKITELRQEKIEHLKKLIASIGEVTLEDEPIIVEAVAIFEWLTLDERNQVDYITLNAAEKALKKLQKAAAEEVDALIEAIGEVKRSSGKAIEAARAAYDALTEGSKAYVKLLDTLLAAEAAYAELGGLGVVGTIAVVVAVLAVGGIGVTLVVVKKPNLLKKKAKAEETAE